MEELIESIMEECIKLECEGYGIPAGKIRQILTEKLEKVEREFKNLEEHARKMDEYIHTNHKSENVVHKKVFNKVEQENKTLKSQVEELKTKLKKAKAEATMHRNAYEVLRKSKGI